MNADMDGASREDLVDEVLRLRAEARALEERVDREAARQRVWFESVFEDAPDPVIVAEMPGRLRWNRAARAMLLPAPLEVDQRGFELRVDLRFPSGERVTLDRLPLLRALRGEVIRGEEYVIHAPDGRAIPVLVSAAPVRAGEIDGSIAIVRDVTSLKSLEAVRERWTAMVAHDLKQPLGAIIMSAGVVSRGAGAQQAIQDAVGRIQRLTTRLGRLVDDLLDHAQIQAGQLRLDSKPADLCELAREAVERFALAEDCEVELDAPAGPIPVLVDPERVEQVLENFLSNAVKYGELDTEIRVLLELHDDHVRTSVTNHGQGLTPEACERAFEPGFRTKEAVESSVKGLGLGLSISRALIQAHGGRIGVESTPGETTTFWFTLPLHVERGREVA
jgi:PAS domain S-box-containing protein